MIPAGTTRTGLLSVQTRVQCRFQDALNLIVNDSFCPVRVTVRIWENLDVTTQAGPDPQILLLCGMWLITNRDTGPGGLDLTRRMNCCCCGMHLSRGKKHGKTQDLLTHFILLFNEANKMPGYPGTSHTCVVEI